MIKKLKTPLLVLLAFTLVGQLAFAAYSPRYMRIRFENSMYATMGYLFDGKGDLHLLNDAAHYFGQTLIGWTKFPSFRDDLVQFAHLPKDTSLNVHMQERQNLVMTLTTHERIESRQLVDAKLFLQGKLDEYNKATNTQFNLTNADYELAEVNHSYLIGAVFAFIFSIALGFAFLFLKKEFFPPRLKL